MLELHQRLIFVETTYDFENRGISLTRDMCHNAERFNALGHGNEKLRLRPFNLNILNRKMIIDSSENGYRQS